MGLDGIEMVIACEERFNVHLEDDDLYKCSTPGKLIDLIFRSLGGGDGSICLSQNVFYRIRKLLLADFNISRDAVKRHSLLANLIPPDKRKMFCQELREEFGVRPPALERPKAMLFILKLFVAVCSLALFCFASMNGRIFDFFLGVLGLNVLCLLFFALTYSYKTHFSANICGLEDLVNFFVCQGITLPQEKEKYIKLTREEIALSVRKIVIEQLALVEGDYAEDKDLVKDLGMG
jgi:acyl carrier protein